MSIFATWKSYPRPLTRNLKNMATFVPKITNIFSSTPIDQAHEQNNDLVKRSGVKSDSPRILQEVDDRRA